MARKEEKILDVNAAMQGNLIFSDPVNLRINGKFKGNLTTKGTLIMGENAEVDADISGETIIVTGKVKGKIKATKIITLRSMAQVVAEMEAPRLSIEEGAFFNGQCKMPYEKMSLSEVSDYLAIEEEKIAEWVKSGKIPVIREGGELLFDRQEVETWVAQNR